MTEKVDYSTAYLEAMKNLKLAHNALISNKFQEAYDYCQNVQAEVRLLNTAIKSWLPQKDD